MDDDETSEYYSDSSSPSYSYSDGSNSSAGDVTDVGATESDDNDSSSAAESSDEKWGVTSSVQALKVAFASPLSDTLGDVELNTRRHLRKQQTRYGNTNTQSVLPMTSAPRSISNCGPMDDFMLINETHGKEKVGHYVDTRGNPVAEVWESKPPPPNADYRSQAPPTSNLKLTRLMGFDPNKVIKIDDLFGGARK